MHIEILTIQTEGLTDPVKVIAIQYPVGYRGLEQLMRQHNPLFDTPVPGMTPVMADRCNHHGFRTAIFALQSETHS